MFIFFFHILLYTPNNEKTREVLLCVFIIYTEAICFNKRYNYKLLTFVTLTEYELKVFKSSSELNNIIQFMLTFEILNNRSSLIFTVILLF